MTTTHTLSEHDPLLKAFIELSAIPRGSGNETAILLFLKNEAKTKGLQTKSDTAGNLLIMLEPSKGFEKLPGVTLQGHVDMVCEKLPDSPHDFVKDPIVPVVEGEWLHASGTTLGADNGIAVAMMLCLMRGEAVHGRIDLLFTIDEENGLTGARNLDPSMLRNSLYINLDSEEDGAIYIGCAGGVETTGSTNLKTETASSGYSWATLSVSGLRGGHSGAEIHRGLGNAIQVLFRILENLHTLAGVSLSLATGGARHNVIPRDASALIGFPEGKFDLVQKLVNENIQAIRAELGPDDQGLKAELRLGAHIPTQCLTENAFQTLVRTLVAFPHGVLSMSYLVDGLVATSTNLASIQLENNGYCQIGTSQRADRESARDFTAQRIEDLLLLSGFEVKHSQPYPSWSPQLGNPLLKLAQQTYKELFGVDAQVKAIHAGLEAGTIGGYKIDMHMISIGPEIQGAHSPSERLNLPSTQKTWAFLVSLLENLGKGGN